MGYLLHAFKGQMSLYNHERPVKEVIADVTTPQKLKSQLIKTQEIRKYTEQVLGVKSTANYSTFVDLKRKYVVWVVTAAAPFELKQKTWSFPIAGTVPYLGFFEEEKAQSYADEIQKSEGFDVYVRGARAYSTLGYLRDPLLSSMLSEEDSEMVNLFFHETAHRYVYIAGDSDFNEAAATFIGDLGEETFITEKFGKNSKELATFMERKSMAIRFALAAKKFSQELATFYKQNQNVPQLAELKREQYRKFVAAATDEREKRFRASLINNAALLAYLNYEDDHDLFTAIKEKCQGNVRRSLSYLRRFVEQLQSPSGGVSTAKQMLRQWKVDCE